MGACEVWTWLWHQWKECSRFFSACPGVGHDKKRFKTLRRQTLIIDSGSVTQGLMNLESFSIIPFPHEEHGIGEKILSFWNSEFSLQFCLPRSAALDRKRCPTDNDNSWKRWQNELKMPGNLKGDLRRQQICKQGCYDIRKWPQNLKFKTDGKSSESFCTKKAFNVSIKMFIHIHFAWQNIWGVKANRKSKLESIS